MFPGLLELPHGTTPGLLPAAAAVVSWLQVFSFLQGISFASVTNTYQNPVNNNNDD